MRRKAAFDLETRGDCDIVIGTIQSRLLTLQTIRPWEKNPDFYSGIASNGAFTIMERKFASPDARLRSVVARERQIPHLIEQAQFNLKNPPHIYTEIAIEQLPAHVRRHARRLQDHQTIAGRRQVDPPRGQVIGESAVIEDRVVAAEREFEAVLSFRRAVACAGIASHAG